ncbi:hypothetical protein H5410_042626 [Solanum commersonii]|uniref:Uncharacterized protein n=1 Tax=Solanum commersonii TaxID=4109 RepID=A0A9J5XY14_SOLCO|nr:hypothetical protein H5410_042626 [Solanum commersonii]
MASSARNHLLVITLLILTCLTTSSSSQEPEAILLLKFKSSLTNTTSLSSWDPLVKLCMQWQRFELERIALLQRRILRVISEREETYRTEKFVNHFSGELPDDIFTGMKFMRRILMANNEFTGSLLGIPKLIELQVQDNQFDGTIPAFAQQDLRLNVANNRLEGPIPPQLSSQSASSFEGNLGLCGKPKPPCPPSK